MGCLSKVTPHPRKNLISKDLVSLNKRKSQDDTILKDLHSKFPCLACLQRMVTHTHLLLIHLWRLLVNNAWNKIYQILLNKGVRIKYSTFSPRQILRSNLLRIVICWTNGLEFCWIKGLEFTVYIVPTTTYKTFFFLKILILKAWTIH